MLPVGYKTCGRVGSGYRRIWPAGQPTQGQDRPSRPGRIQAKIKAGSRLKMAAWGRRCRPNAGIRVDLWCAPLPELSAKIPAGHHSMKAGRSCVDPT